MSVNMCDANGNLTRVDGVPGGVTSSGSLVACTLQSGYTAGECKARYERAGNVVNLTVYINNINGANIGTNNSADVCVLPSGFPLPVSGSFNNTAIDFTKTSTQIRLTVKDNGHLWVTESNGVTAGSNSIRGNIIYFTES